MKLEIILSIVITITAISAAYGQNEADNNINNVPNVTRYDEVGRPYDNKGDIEVIIVDGILENKTDLDDWDRINIGVEATTLLPLCGLDYERKKDILGDKCFNYDENYVMYFRGLNEKLDPNEWMEMRKESP